MWFIKFLIVAVPTVVVLFSVGLRFDKATGTAKVRPSGLVGTALVCILMFVVVSGFGTIKQGFSGVVTTFDRATGAVKTPGLYWVVPIRDAVIPVDTRLYEEPMTIEAATSDQQDVTMKVSINYRVRPSSAVYLFSEYQRDYSGVLRDAMEFWSKNAAGHYTPQQMLNNRAGLANDIRISLNDRSPEGAPQLEPFEIIVVNVSNLEFSGAYTQSIEDKQVAEQDALKEENIFRQVQLQAQQELERSKVEAEKIRIQAEAITSQGGMEYVMLQLIQAWDGAYPDTLIINGSDGAGGPFQIFDIGRLINSK